MKKVVLKLDLHDDKQKQKAMEAVSSLSGVNSISMDMKGRKLTLIGDMDPVDVAAKLRKLCHTEILTVGPAKQGNRSGENSGRGRGRGSSGRGGGDCGCSDVGRGGRPCGGGRGGRGGRGRGEDSRKSISKKKMIALENSQVNVDRERQYHEFLQRQYGGDESFYQSSFQINDTSFFSQEFLPPFYHHQPPIDIDEPYSFSPPKISSQTLSHQPIQQIQDEPDPTNVVDVDNDERRIHSKKRRSDLFKYHMKKVKRSDGTKVVVCHTTPYSIEVQVCVDDWTKGRISTTRN